MREKPTGRPRGFGFVVFSNPSVLDHVLQDRHTIEGRTISLFPPSICIPFLVSIVASQLFFVSRFWFLNWFDLDGCDCKSVVVGLLFMVLVCGGGLCDDGGFGLNEWWLGLYTNRVLVVGCLVV